ncbi:MAG: twin-arginine translocase TatA/TatE family subunit [Thaumarchaeota archaeon]|nr:twin-arginine translocase TatA/TatE family subunit [Nitrososphaerota archaeon]
MTSPLFIPQGMEIIIIGIVIIVLIFGAKKIPDIAKSLGRAGGEFKKGKQEADKEAKDAALEDEKPESSEKEHDKLLNVAKGLGITVEGKNDEVLRKEIEKALWK